jgi:flavin-dependent dehydrogenase
MFVRCDVAIMGGGPAGIASALALACRGRSVIVLERTHYDQVRIGETLPPIARLPLAHLGLRALLAEGEHLPSPGIISAWGQAELFEESFIFNAYGRGWQLDRSRFDAAMALAAEDAGARVYLGARINSFKAAPCGGWQIDFLAEDRCQCIRASFLVDATGRASSLARRLGAKRNRYDRLVGVVGFVTSERPGESYDPLTLVEAGASGWWYSVYLPSGQLVVTYMTDADLLPRGTARVGSYWYQQLEQAPHTRARVNNRAVESGLKTVAASSSILDRVSGERWLAVGDAAMTYDPLSSYGVCKALNSGLEAADAIERWSLRQADALPAFTRSVHSDFRKYLAMRAMHYRREQRWPASPFWQRRQAAQPGNDSLTAV